MVCVDLRARTRPTTAFSNVKQAAAGTTCGPEIEHASRGFHRAHQAYNKSHSVRWIFNATFSFALPGNLRASSHHSINTNGSQVFETRHPASGSPLRI